MQGNLEKLSKFSFCFFFQIVTERYFNIFKIPVLYQSIYVADGVMHFACKGEVAIYLLI